MVSVIVREERQAEGNGVRNSAAKLKNSMESRQGRWIVVIVSFFAGLIFVVRLEVLLVIGLVGVAVGLGAGAGACAGAGTGAGASPIRWSIAVGRRVET